MSSTYSEIEAIEPFIRRMHDLGAASVQVGDIKVVFDIPLVQAPQTAAPEETDPKKASDQLLYGSSD